MVVSVIVAVDVKTWQKNKSMKYTMLQEKPGFNEQRRTLDVQSSHEIAGLGISLRRFPVCV